MSVRFRYVDQNSANHPTDEIVAEGTTVRAYLAVRLGAQTNLNDFDVVVNSSPVSPDYVLKTGDRLSVGSKKVVGA